MAGISFVTFLLLSGLPETKGMVSSDVETEDKNNGHPGGDDVINGFELVKSETNGGLEAVVVDKIDT